MDLAAARTVLQRDGVVRIPDLLDAPALAAAQAAYDWSLANPSLGHKYGAHHAEELLGWCERAGIGHVTVFMCSAENLAQRDSGEVAFLMRVIEELVAGRLTRDPVWQVHIAGNLCRIPLRRRRRIGNKLPELPSGIEVS